MSPDPDLDDLTLADAEPADDVDQADDSSEPYVITDEIAWVIDGYTEQRPFGARLIIGNTDTQISVDLDPQTVAELADALDTIRTAQRAAILGEPVTPKATTPATAEPATAVDKDAATGGATAWWAKHKILLALVSIVGLCLVISAVSGALTV